MPLQDEPPITYGPNDVIDIGLKRHFENASLSPELAAALNPVTIRPGIHAMTLTASLHVQDNKYELKVSRNHLYYLLFI